MKTNRFNPYTVKLDDEEQALLDSFERGEWKSVEDLEAAKTFAQEVATNTLRKDARINIRISRADLKLLKQRAAYKGLPYQTLIASVLHEYAAGHFERQA